MKLNYFNLARKASYRSNSKIKMGCVVTRKKSVYSGWNSMTTTHPKSKSYGNYLHAEIHAIIRSKGDIEGSDVYVYRETKTGNLGNSKPCSVCYTALKSAKVRRVCYIENGRFVWEYVT